MATEQELKIIEDNKEIIKKIIDSQQNIVDKLGIIETYKTNINKSSNNVVKEALLKFLEEQKKDIANSISESEINSYAKEIADNINSIKDPVAQKQKIDAAYVELTKFPERSAMRQRMSGVLNILSRNINLTKDDELKLIQPKASQEKSDILGEVSSSIEKKNKEAKATLDENAELERLNKEEGEAVADITKWKSLLAPSMKPLDREAVSAEIGKATTKRISIQAARRALLKNMRDEELAIKELAKEIRDIKQRVGTILTNNNNEIKDVDLSKSLDAINKTITKADESKNRDDKLALVSELASEYGKLKGQYDVAKKAHEEEKRRTANTQEGLRNRLSDLLSNLTGLQAASRQKDETNLLTEVKNYIRNTIGKNLDQSIIAELEGKYKGLERIKKQNESRRKVEEFKKMAPQDQLAALLGEKIPRELQGEFSVASIIGSMDFGNNQWFKEYLQKLAEVKSPSYEQISKAIGIFRNREQAFDKVDNTEGISDPIKTAIKKELIANPNTDADVAISRFVKGYQEAIRTGRQKQVEDAATARASAVESREALKKQIDAGEFKTPKEKAEAEATVKQLEDDIAKYKTEVIGEGELQRLKGRTEELRKRLEESKQSLRQLEGSDPSREIRKETQHIPVEKKGPVLLEANKRLTAWNKAKALKKKEIAQLELAIKDAEKAVSKESGIVSGKIAAEEKMDKEAQNMIVQKRIDDKKKEARTMIESISNLSDEKKNTFITEISNIPKDYSEQEVDEAIRDTLNEANKQALNKEGLVEVEKGVFVTPEQAGIKPKQEEPKITSAQEQPKPQAVQASMQDLTTAQNAETRLDELAPAIAIAQNRLAALPFTGNPAQIQVAIDEVNKIIAESPNNKEAPVKLAQYTKALEEAAPLMGTLQNALAERDSLRKIVSDFIAKYGRTPLHMTAEEFQTIISGGVNQ